MSQAEKEILLAEKKNIIGREKKHLPSLIKKINRICSNLIVLI